jgi:hypothetical protein
MSMMKSWFLQLRCLSDWLHYTSAEGVSRDTSEPGLILGARSREAQSLKIVKYSLSYWDTAHMEGRSMDNSHTPAGKKSFEDESQATFPLPNVCEVRVYLQQLTCFHPQPLLSTRLLRTSKFSNLPP